MDKQLDLRMHQFKRGHLFIKSTKTLLFFSGVAAFIFFSGCASTMPEKKQDDFIDKWLMQSETARGHSPDVRERDVLEIEDTFPDFDQYVEPEAEKPLPEDRVTLRLSDAPVGSVLRAMARAADQNMLIGESVTGHMSIDIRNIPWNQAFKSIIDSRGLTYSWEGEIIRIRSMADIQNEIALSEKIQALNMQRLGIGMTGPLQNRIIKINYADAPKLSENLTEFLSKDRNDKIIGRIAVNEETNSLIIQATRDDMNRITRMIEHLDRPRAQILIEANIVEANRETARELGMRWSGRYVTSSGSMDNLGIVGDPTVPAESFLGLDGMSLGIIAGRATGNVLYADLQALQRDGKLNILSSPSITTMDNQMAYTEHGEKVPYETTVAAVGGVQGVREVEFEDAVLRLEVIPGIIDGEYMKMNIKVKKDEVDFTRTVNGNPLIRRKETETNLVVRNGETIVISGLSKQTVTGEDEGVPVLKDIPLLGWLFKGERKSQEMEEFLIFITPTILGIRGV
jgi:type IV pilus assembly protein PilQ